jgi:hypothetical protein
MSKFGDDLIKSTEEALAHARGEPSDVRTTRVLISGQDLMDVMQRSPHKEIDLVPLGFPMPVRDVEL